MMRDVPQERRTARFHCALALASPSGQLGEWEGVCEGRIAESARGSEGFGFDPIFVADGQTRTNAELSPEEKNAISHRGIAMRRFAADLPRMLAATAADGRTEPPTRPPCLRRTRPPDQP